MDEELNVTKQSAAPALKDFKVKPLFQKRGIDIIMAVILFLLSVFGVSALLWDELNLGYTIVFDLAVIIISAFLIKKGVKLCYSFVICGILSLVCSWSFFTTSNTAVKAVSFIATLISAIIWFISASGKEYESGDYNLISYLFNAVSKAFSDIPGIFKSLFSKDKSKSKTVSNILIGVICAIPAVLIIVPILANADDAFEALISGLFDDYFTLIQKLILGTGVSIILAGIVFSLKYNTEQYSTKELSVKANNISVSAFLCVLCGVYSVYLFSQLAYFFSAFSSILPKGYKFTYAQYARRGFFELCIIAVINLLFIFAAIVISEKKDGKIHLSIKLPATFIVLFTFAIIFTALSKMVMYIGVYGCTVLRICTSAFMIWLFILFICLLIRIFVKRFDFLKAGLIFALIILLGLGLSNVNRQIARYNYNAYKQGKIKMDVEYMADIGDEGVPYLYKLTKDKDSKIANKAITELNDKFTHYYNVTVSKKYMHSDLKKLERTYKTFGEYSLPRARAYKVLDEYAKSVHNILYD